MDVGIGINRNAKPQLGIRVYRAKLGLGVPSRAVLRLMHLNLMAVRG